MSLNDIGPVVLVGAGKMGLALAKGWIAGGLPPSQLVLVDPFAVLSPGFWLSFLTVGALLWLSANRSGRQHWLRVWAGTQWAATLASFGVYTPNKAASLAASAAAAGRRLLGLG